MMEEDYRKIQNRWSRGGEQYFRQRHLDEGLTAPVFTSRTKFSCFIPAYGGFRHPFNQRMTHVSC